VDGLGGTHYAYNAVGQVLREDGPFDADTVSYGYTNHSRTGLAPRFTEHGFLEILASAIATGPSLRTFSTLHSKILHFFCRTYRWYR
jgi:hypothetical protein